MTLSDAKGPLWLRPEPAVRPTPVTLSRASIVAAAITIADEATLESVTLRGVAASLGAGTMRLYAYLALKEDLVDLMIDAVYAEIVNSKNRSTDGGKITHLAQAIRAAALRHPWFAELLGGRPHQGPNALNYLEEMLAAVEEVLEGRSIDVVFQKAKIINAYIVGAIRSEANDILDESKNRGSKQQWQRESWPYLQTMLATGRFPTISRVVADANHPSAVDEFDHGLQTILKSISVTESPRTVPKFEPGGYR